MKDKNKSYKDGFKDGIKAGYNDSIIGIIAYLEERLEILNDAKGEQDE